MTARRTTSAKAAGVRATARPHTVDHSWKNVSPFCSKAEINAAHEVRRFHRAMPTEKGKKKKSICEQFQGQTFFSTKCQVCGELTSRRSKVFSPQWLRTFIVHSTRFRPLHVARDVTKYNPSANSAINVQLEKNDNTGTEK